MIETAFRVTSRVADDASTAEYHAVSTVRSSPKARMAMPMATMVRIVLTLRRKAFFMIILGRIIPS
ncbi:MAG: hypothetical protein BWX71_02542 [Deltaproteobacteria bacterium ADurb.Bin072]|nr:MAG: hypothetical protein BWX71_02542 [Deltaproteobacteria bacterium ADurb.Bin072]